MDHDRNFKELLSAFFVEFVELCLPEAAEQMDKNFAVVPLTQEMFGDIDLGDRSEVDLVMKVRFRGEEAFFIIHVENQASAQADFPQRMFRYYTRLTEKFGLPVYPVVIFSYDRPLIPAPASYTVEFAGRIVLKFDYAVIQLNRMPWQEFARRENPVACALMAKMKMEPKDRPKVKLECLRLLATLKLDPSRSKLIGGFIDSYLKLTAEENKEYERELAQFAPKERSNTVALISSWEQRGIDKGISQGRSLGVQEGISQGRSLGVQEGISQGRSLGVQEGISQGISQGKERLVERLIRKRLGAVPSGAEKRLGALTADQLDLLGEALLDFSDAGDLEKWLARNPPN